MNDQKLKIAAVADLHGHEESAGLHRDFFAQVASEADVLLICGDLSNYGLPKEALNLAQDLAGVRIPVLAVLGNHDYESNQVEKFKDILTNAGVKFLEDGTVTIQGVGFAGTKGFAGGFSNHMLGAFGELPLKSFVAETLNECLKLENQLKSLETEKTVALLHYAPIAATIKGEAPEIYPWLGCSRFAEVIDRYNVSAVFHGHAHHGEYEGHTDKGVPVYNCTYELMKKKNPNKPFALLEI